MEQLRGYVDVVHAGIDAVSRSIDTSSDTNFTFCGTTSCSSGSAALTRGWGVDRGALAPNS
jgi:hypothetical protein